MKIFTSNYKLIIILQFCATIAIAQNDSALIKRVSPDTSKLNMNLDAVYNRPFLQVGKAPIAIGGYMEVNTNYAGTDGVSEGFSFQFRRFTIFMASTITKKIKFLTEIEFEDGTREINLEFAAADFEFHPLVNLRGGIILNPIGAFNQNHDGPKWEFIERPISSTQMLPATWSNAGFGLYGKSYQSNWTFAYETYLTNGFNANIIDNVEGKTFLPASKLDVARFEESFSGTPMFTGKVAVKRRKIGELGLSYMGGIYNKFKVDGIVVDEKRSVNVFAIDFNTIISKTKTSFIAEYAWVHVDLPPLYLPNYGSKQHGGYLDIVQPILRRKMFGWEKAVLNLALRTEYVDWNAGTFDVTGGKIYENIFAIIPAITFRPVPQTVIRFNYIYRWQTDILGNAAIKTAAIQFGVSSYF